MKSTRRGRRDGGGRRPATNNATRVEADITELASGGEGVAICEIGGERRAVFVPGVAVGERVLVEADMSTRPARGVALQVLRVSPSRVEPACADATRCGACDWMHLDERAREDAYLQAIARMLPKAYAGVVPSLVRATTPLGYRARARVHVEADARGVVVGMFGRRSRSPVAVASCAVLHPSVERARARLSSWLAGARGRGEARIALGAPHETGGSPAPDRSAVVDLRWSGTLPAEVFGRAEGEVARGALAGVRIFDGDVRVPATIGDPTPWVEGADGAPLRLAPGGFSQASERGNAALVSYVAAIAAPFARDATVVELYAGAGNLTVALARSGPGKLIAVEDDEAACDAARANLLARGLSARVVRGDAATHAIPAGTGLVVIDPPRTGAREVCTKIAAKPVPALIYVSCDLPTLGRDLGVLEGAGYRLVSLRAFELFPQTSHVETVAELVRGPGRPAKSS